MSPQTHLSSRGLFSSIRIISTRAGWASPLDSSANLFIHASTESCPISFGSTGFPLHINFGDFRFRIFQIIVYRRYTIIRRKHSSVKHLFLILEQTCNRLTEGKTPLEILRNELNMGQEEFETAQNLGY